MDNIIRNAMEDSFEAINLCKTNTSKYMPFYHNTNENLSRLFYNFSIKNKNVLSVLGSSDQVFSCLYYGAKEVDSFDVNRLTIYYYYLRKWLLKENIEYPNEDNINILENNKNLYTLIQNLKIDENNINENKARLFWLNYLYRTPGKLTKNLFFKTVSARSQVPYKYALDIVYDKIPNKDIIFYNMDILKNFKIDKKYDIIILSNILEYAFNTEDFEIVRENLDRLLNPGGEAICSYIINEQDSKRHSVEEKVITRNNLSIREFNDEYKDIFNNYVQVGYAYTKRK